MTKEPGQDPEPEIERSRVDFHVVGVGASAGGLEALVDMFRALPPESGMSFVIVQHLSPDFESHMDDLLGRHTQMPICQVQNGMQIEPNSIYLMPRKMEMVISDGKLLLTAKSNERGLSHPIDQFLRSLASDVGRFAIGVILSGTGSDGSRGIRDIREAGGFVVAQDGHTAKFDGMPKNARATGAVDVVLPPEAIADTLVRYVGDGIAAQEVIDDDPPGEETRGGERILQIVHEKHGLDFANYKSSTVGRRIQRRAQLLGIDSLEDYIVRLQDNTHEVDELYRDLLIGVTRFFRDTEAFDVLKREVIPKVVASNRESGMIRIWVAGCATGEEAYSLAILVDEELRRQDLNLEVKIFATDAHQGSLYTASRGVFPEQSLSEMSEERRRRYFRRAQDCFAVTGELRRYIVFAPHNLLHDAPFTQMDLVSCRNLLIYLQPAAQKKAMSVLHFSLKHDAFLWLGSSESPGALADEFRVRDKRWRIYTKSRDVRMPLSAPMPLIKSRDRGLSNRISPTLRHNQVSRDLLRRYDQLLERKMPPSILIDESTEVLHIFGGAERLVRSRRGRPSSHLFDLLEETLKAPIVSALQHARRQQSPVSYTGIRYHDDEGEKNLDLAIETLGSTKGGNASYLIEFKFGDEEPPIDAEDVPAEANTSTRRVVELESELQQSEENLQAAIEEMETSNEELQAANEELVASNEELQSTNEELQSVNEELYTVNAEHQRRVAELAEANDDMDNLLATTRVGVIFLDEQLLIRRFTPEIARLFNLAPQDIGRPIANFSHVLEYDPLADDLQRVLEDRQERENEVRDRDDRRYLMRILPYRSGDNVQGVVLTLIDIQKLRAAQTDLERHKFMIESASDPILLVSSDARIAYLNPAACQQLGYGRDELVGMKFDAIEAEKDRDLIRKLVEEPSDQSSRPYTTSWRRKDGSLLPVEVGLNSLAFDGHNYVAIHARNIGERLAAERELKLRHLAIESTLNGVIIVDATRRDFAISYANPGFCRLTGYAPEEVLGRNCRFLQGPDTDPDVVAELREAIRSCKPCRVLIRNYRKDGSEFWNDLQITPIFDEQGELIQYVGTQNDVTAQIRAQEKLERANRTAEAASRAKSAFLANMSHELRTPMTAVLGFADILSQESDEPEFIEKVDTIRRNGNYLLTLLNDILDLSKIEAGKLEIASNSVDLSEVIDDLQSLMGVRARQEGIPLFFEFAGSIPKSITGDHVRIRQILVNLIGNALKFTDSGSVRVVVELRNRRSQSTVEISVIDTGIGMTEEQRKTLFKPFNQGSNTARRFGGTGLGLSISKRLAEAMGGTIEAESRENVGSRFTLSLPVSESQLTELQKSPSKQSIPLTDGERQLPLPELRARILLADDRRDVWRIGKYFLEKCGAKVTVVEDGRQAVDAVLGACTEGNAFDLVLMDMQMPVMTGREAVAELRSRGINIPVIALTADAMDGEREACLAAGCDEYFAKPIDGSKLMNLIATMLSENGCPRNSK